VFRVLDAILGPEPRGEIAIPMRDSIAPIWAAVNVNFLYWRRNDRIPDDKRRTRNPNRKGAADKHVGVIAGAVTPTRTLANMGRRRRCSLAVMCRIWNSTGVGSIAWPMLQRI